MSQVGETCREEEEERKVTINDLPQEVLLLVLSELSTWSLSNFLIANPNAASLRGVYELWQKVYCNCSDDEAFHHPAINNRQRVHRLLQFRQRKRNEESKM